MRNNNFGNGLPGALPYYSEMRLLSAGAFASGGYVFTWQAPQNTANSYVKGDAFSLTTTVTANDSVLINAPGFYCLTFQLANTSASDSAIINKKGVAYTNNADPTILAIAACTTSNGGTATWSGILYAGDVLSFQSGSNSGSFTAAGTHIHLLRLPIG